LKVTVRGGGARGAPAAPPPRPGMASTLPLLSSEAPGCSAAPATASIAMGSPSSVAPL